MNKEKKVKPRLLVFIGGSYVSGLEIVTLHLMRGLKERNFDLHCVINGWNDGVMKEKVENLGIPCTPVKLGWLHLRKPLWTVDTLIHYPAAYLKCRKIINEFKPDLFHFCNYSNPLMLSPLIKKKSVLNIQESELPSRKNLWIYGKMSKKIDVFTAVSKHIVQVFERLNIPSEKIRLIYNGVPPITNIPALNIQTDSPLVFALIGQVVPWKGHETVINAVEHLVSNSTNNFRVEIYGNDKVPYGETLRTIIAQKNLNEYFVWKGFLKEQSDIYRNCQVVIVPSLSQEPCSLSVIESMMYGKGLIVSDRGGNPELVQHEFNGLVHTAEDFKDLANCMTRFIQNPQQAVIFGDIARNKALEEYTYTNMTNKYVDIFNELLAESK